MAITKALNFIRSSMACHLFQPVLQSTSASLDTGPCPMQDSYACSTSLLLLQGDLLLLHSGDQLPSGRPGGSLAALPGTAARASSPEATAHSALLVRGHHCTMDREVYLDFLHTCTWSEVRAVVTRQRFWRQHEQDGATEHTAVRVRKWLEARGEVRRRGTSWFSGRPLHPCTQTCRPWTTASGRCT